MPRVPECFLSGVGFLYQSEADAHAHKKTGGTCFIVGKKLNVPGLDAYASYFVSNLHVVWTNGAPVIRVNRKDGKQPDVFPADCSDWIEHPGGDDIAMLPSNAISSTNGIYLNRLIHDISFVATEDFVDDNMIAEHDIGVGDEVFMVGRFINHQGLHKNSPSVRLGSISMMNDYIYNSCIKKNQESYAVEMRSRTGFSGSPVFVYGTPMTTLKAREKTSFQGLLGVNWGYILDEPDLNGDRENTWMNGVAPAKKILETLNNSRLADHHRRHEEGLKSRPPSLTQQIETTLR